jgi:DNA helicase II / ATP-dependent DNA helicase PcrA
MKSNKLIIASAGSGKTTFLVEEALRRSDQRVVIATFTLSNEAELRERFVRVRGYVPAHVSIQTWFSFLIQHGVRPYQSTVLRSDIAGLLLVNEQSARGVGEDRPEAYYLSPSRRLYSDKVSKLAVRCNDHSGGHVVDRLSRIFPHVFIDEAQDLAGYDLDFVKALFVSRARVVLVADPRQVVYSTHRETRHGKYANGKIIDFVQAECRRANVEIDEGTLAVSYRSGQAICDISDCLYPSMKTTSSRQTSVTGHDGVFAVRRRDVDAYLETFRPVQLRLSSRVPVHAEHPVRTFGDAKGLSFDRVLIYPTQEMSRWACDHDGVELADGTRAKFYVALTRARYSVAMVWSDSKAAPPPFVTWQPG